MKDNLSCSLCPCIVEPLLISALHPIIFWCYFSLDKSHTILSASLRKFPPHNPFASEGSGSFSWRVSTALGSLSKQVKGNSTNASLFASRIGYLHSRLQKNTKQLQQTFCLMSPSCHLDYSQIFQWTHFPRSSPETEIISGMLPICSDLEVTNGNHFDVHVQASCIQNNLIKAFF